MPCTHPVPFNTVRFGRGTEGDKECNTGTNASADVGSGKGHALIKQMGGGPSGPHYAARVQR